MTLKQKFWNDGTLYDLEMNPDECVKIADEFAIEFAEWLISSSVLKTELPMIVKLKMYKNQKGL